MKNSYRGNSTMAQNTSEEKKSKSIKLEKALASLGNIEEQQRLNAVKFLAGSNDPRVIHSLQKVAQGDQSLQIRFLAKEGLQQIRASLTQKIGIDFSKGEESSSSNVKPINLKKLEQALSNPNPSDRTNAVKAAISYMNPQALKVLIPHLKKEREIRVKRNCIMAIGVLGNKEHIPLLLHYLEHKEPHYRLKAVAGLGCVNDIASYPRLVNSMSDPNKHVRAAALQTVLKLGKPKVLKLIQKMTVSKQKWMRKAAARSCGKLKSSKVLKILTTSLNDKDEDVRKAARGSLRRLNKTGLKAAGKLLEAYKNAGGEVTLENFSLPSDIGNLASPLNDDDPRTRLDEIQRMVEEKDTSLLEMAIARLAVEKDEHVLSSLIIAIGRLHGKNAIEHITPFLKSEHIRIVASAVEALSFIDSPTVIPLLTPFLESEDNRVCANAIVALKDASGVDIISPLKKLATHSERNHKLSAIYAILEINSIEAGEVLKLMESSPDTEVSDRAGKARNILSDRSIGAPSERGRKSAEIEIPGELLVQSPEEDADAPTTKSLKNIDDGDSLSDSDGQTDLSSGKSREPEKIDKDTKKQPGFRTQIDQMFVQAAKEPVRTKPKAKTKPIINNVSEEKPSILEQIRNLIKPSEPTPAADGKPNASNIILICVAVVVVVILGYMVFGGGGGGSMDDEFYSDSDF